MVKKERIVVEAEVVDSASAGKRQQTYVSYSQKPADPALVGVWVLSVIAIFLSFIPVIGLCVAFIALIACVIKKIPPVLPIFAIIIGSVTTGIFMFFWLVLRAIF